MTEYQDTQRGGEIDLRKLFETFGNFLGRCWLWIIGLVIGIRNLTVRFKILLAVAVGGGLLWATYSTKAVDPYYQGSIILKSDYLKPQVLQNMTDELNRMSDSELAEKLSIDDTVAASILTFRYAAMLADEEKLATELLKTAVDATKMLPEQKAVLYRSFREQMQSYELQILAYNVSIIPEIMEALKGYVAEYPYVKSRLTIDRKNQEEKKEKLIHESAKLDSLKAVIFKNLEARSKDTRQGSNNVILADGEASNPLNVFEQEIKFFDQILAIDRALVLQENFQIYNGPLQTTTPASPRFIDNAIIGIGYALAAAYIIIFLIQINAYLNRVERMQASKAEDPKQE